MSVRKSTRQPLLGSYAARGVGGEATRDLTLHAPKGGQRIFPVGEEDVGV